MGEAEATTEAKLSAINESLLQLTMKLRRIAARQDQMLVTLKSTTAALTPSATTTSLAMWDQASTQLAAKYSSEKVSRDGREAAPTVSRVSHDLFAVAPTRCSTLGLDNNGGRTHAALASPSWGNTEATLLPPLEPSLDKPLQSYVDIKFSTLPPTTCSKECCRDGTGAQEFAFNQATSSCSSPTPPLHVGASFSPTPPVTVVPVGIDISSHVASHMIDRVTDEVFTNVGGLSLFLELDVDDNASRAMPMVSHGVTCTTNVLGVFAYCNPPTLSQVVLVCDDAEHVAAYGFSQLVLQHDDVAWKPWPPDLQVSVSHKKCIGRPRPWPSFDCNQLKGVQMTLAMLPWRTTYLVLPTVILALLKWFCTEGRNLLDIGWRPARYMEHLPFRDVTLGSITVCSSIRGIIVLMHMSTFSIYLNIWLASHLLYRQWDPGVCCSLQIVSRNLQYMSALIGNVDMVFECPITHPTHFYLEQQRRGDIIIYSEDTKFIVTEKMLTSKPFAGACWTEGYGWRPPEFLLAARGVALMWLQCLQWCSTYLGMLLYALVSAGPELLPHGRSASAIRVPQPANHGVDYNISQLIVIGGDVKVAQNMQFLAAIWPQLSNGLNGSIRELLGQNLSLTEAKNMHMIGTRGYKMIIVPDDLSEPWDPGIASIYASAVPVCVKARRSQCGSGSYSLLPSDHAIAWGQAMFCRGGSVTPDVPIGPQLSNGLLRWARPKISRRREEGIKIHRRSTGRDIEQLKNGIEPKLCSLFFLSAVLSLFLKSVIRSSLTPPIIAARGRVVTKRNCADLLSEYLAVVPCTVEENVAVAIHGVSGGNRAVHRQWPIRPESFLVYFLDFDREDLQSAGNGSSITRLRSVCEVHRTQ